MNTQSNELPLHDDSFSSMSEEQIEQQRKKMDSEGVLGHEPAHKYCDFMFRIAGQKIIQRHSGKEMNKPQFHSDQSPQDIRRLLLNTNIEYYLQDKVKQ